jgi:hypothetical protein
MYNGFPATNTPSIQVWDFSRPGASIFATQSITLTDDCAPIQYFRTGSNTTAIAVYLPISPPEGNIIKIINHRYGNATQQVQVFYPDATAGGAVRFFALGVGQTIDFCYSKIAYGFGPNVGYQTTGWMMLNQAGSSSTGYYGVSISDGGHAVGVQSMVLGGTGGTASGTTAIVAGGTGNTASAQNAATLGGSYLNASSFGSVALGGFSSNASGLYAVAVGGSTNTPNNLSCVVVGGSYGTTRSVSGQVTFPASNTPLAVTAGATQASLLCLGVATTDATVTTLRSDTSAATTTNQLVLPNNSAYYVRGSCIANVTGAGNTKSWTFEAAIKRGASAATTAIVGAVIKNIVAADAGAATWDITIDADTANGALRVRVTGQASTTIRWVCRLDSTEVTY